MLRWIALAFLIASATAPSLSAQQSDQWRRIDPQAGTQYHRLAWDDNGMLYLVAGGGVVARSADSGRTGTGSVVDDQAKFTALVYAGSSGLWTVGNGGRVYRSVDGTTWQAKPVGLNADLADIAFSTPSIAVVVGGIPNTETGVMFRTMDTGESWQSVQVPDSVWLFDVEFRGAIGLAVGRNGTILRSSDGGATWTVADRFFEHSGYLSAVSFASDTVAVAAGMRYYQGQRRAQIFHSTDAGVTWSEAVFDVATLELHDIAFATPLRGTALGPSATVMTTTNGGAVWSAAVPAFDGYDIEYFDSVYAMAVGSGGSVHITTDGGRTWSRRSAAALGGSYYDVALDGSGRIIATGARGHLVISDGGQQSLRWIESHVRSSLMATTWLPGGGFLAVGDSGVVIRGTAAGDIELDTPLGKSVWLTDVAVDARGTVWMVGRDSATSLVWNSTNGGGAWSAVTSPTKTEMHGIATHGGTDIWVVGKLGEIYRTTDGGATWTDRRYSATFTLRAVHAIDRDTIIAVGDDGIFFRTTDAGESWHMPTTYLFAFRDVAFADGRNGVAVGNQERALVTTDAGASWQVSTPQIVGILEGVAIRGGRVVAVSTSGEIVVRDLIGAARVRESATVTRGAVLNITRSEGALTITVDPGTFVIREIALVDALGRELARRTIDNAGTRTVRIDLPPGTPQGVLFVVVEMRDGSRSVGRIEV